MSLGDRFVDAIVGVEQALDRAKLGYKERFRRFEPAAIVAYRGYGRVDRLLVRGRVMEANETGFDPEPGLWDNIRNTIRRLETDEIRGARVRARFRDIELETRADEEAFFEFRIDLERDIEPGWHPVELEIVESMAHEHAGPATAHVRVPPPEMDFVVISDLDDTVLRTGATSRLRMFRTVLLNDAHTRLPFEGVRALYRALERGPEGRGSNPFFYLSRSPWNLYDMLVGFLDHHDLPKGPLLLQDIGLRGLLGGGEEEPYKRTAVEHLMELYPDTPFVLIGDSGQRDPEVYARLAREHPGRVRAIIVRDVTPPERDREVRRIADEVARRGVPVIVAADSADAAEQAAALGLIPADAVREVEADRSSDQRPRSTLDRLLSKP